MTQGGSANDGSTLRVLAAIVLSIGIFLLWSEFGGPVKGKQKPAEKGQQSSEKIAKKEAGQTATEKDRGASAEAKIAKRSTGEPTAGPVVEAAQEKYTTLEWPAGNATVSFSDRGATLRHAVLLNQRFKEKRDGKLRQVDLVQPHAGPWPLETTFPDSDFKLPKNAKFTLIKQEPQRATYEWRSAQVTVVKDYVLDKARQLMWMTLSVHNRTDKALRHRLQLRLFSQDNGNGEKAGITNPYPKLATALCHVNGEVVRRSLSSIQGNGSGGCGPGSGCGMGEGEFTLVGDVRWIGSGDRYFMTAAIPLDDSSGRARCGLQLAERDEETIQASVLFPQGTLEAKSTIRRRFAVYVGPKDLDALSGVVGAKQEEARLGEAINFGFFAFLSRPLLFLMKAFYRFTGNWGVAIILLTFLIKLVTAYWSTKSMRSMRNMQRLKPKIDVLREKYKDDKQRMNQELMNLYRVHKASPLGGCLPMFIQMPVWFALYSTLGNAQELYRSGFLGWITDLTASDPYYILPLAVGAAMFGQQAISPQPMEGAQAKVMKYMMPGMFTVFMIWLPAGLTLYILVNTVLTMIHQWYINKSDPIETESTTKSGDGKGKAVSGRRDGAQRAVTGGGFQAREQKRESGNFRTSEKSNGTKSNGERRSSSRSKAGKRSRKRRTQRSNAEQ